MTKKTIKLALTGGGTAGHVMPHVALMPRFQELGWEIYYIGSSGVEKALIGELKDVPFFEITTGKLRRYFSMKNVTDIFRVFWGTLQSLGILIRNRPHLVFSKGGFVSVPVAVAAWTLRIPVISHESDLTPGLANRIISFFAKELLYSFPETESLLASHRATLVGLPVRMELQKGDRQKGLDFCGFEKGDLPVILIMGGSLGAQSINDLIETSLDDLTRRFRVIHLTGKGKGNKKEHEHYRQFEFVSEELRDLLALADIVICRAGANSIFELLALKKPMVLIPLEKGSRGDQLDNGRCFVNNGWASLIREAELDMPRLLEELDKISQNLESIKDALGAAYGLETPESRILKILSSVAGG